ncbi:MAG: DEAD/DEAH box helicase [Lentisphaeria bacterium]|nr:DEAD/DEAH box helicase [Lentisphaeria bacterium]NQZ68666.1 DEAD/DEAH box helicase [Lentisphaeria bacterium]
MNILRVYIEFGDAVSQVSFTEEDEDDERQVSIQYVYNLSVKAKKGTLQDFSEHDEQILKQFFKDLAKPKILMANPPFLKLPTSDVKKMVKRWDDVPDRFIEKRSGKTIHENLAKAKLFFELEFLGEQSSLSAIVEAPDGKRKFWMQVKDSFSSVGNEILIDRELLNLDLTVPAELLNKVFAKQNPKLPSKLLAEHLPALLDNRLDLLRGPAVTHEKSSDKLQLRIDEDGANIRIQALNANSVINDLDANKLFQFRLEGERFIVKDLRSPEMEAMTHFLDSLPGTYQDGEMRIQGLTKNIMALHKALKKVPNSLDLRICKELKGLLKRESIDSNLVVNDHSSWIEFQSNFSVKGQGIDASSLRNVSKDQSVIRTRDGSWFIIDEASLTRAQNILDETLNEKSIKKSASTASTMIDKLEALQDGDFSETVAALKARLKSDDQRILQIDESIDSILREYQKDGVSFLSDAWKYRVGALLADDMGLGKTLQVMAVLHAIKKVDDKKALIVCPASVLSVWKKEAEKFFTDLKVQIVRGEKDKRDDLYDSKCDLIVVSYATARNDIESLSLLDFSAVILDEAQQIKNPTSQIAKAVKLLNSDWRLAMTGTPVENRLRDLWSIMDFLNPGFLGSLDEFDEFSGVQNLKESIKPFTLRRRKKDVAKDLPERIEESVMIDMDSGQASAYQQLKRELKANLKGNMDIFAAITRLRQFCCHPQLISQHEIASAKTDYLMMMLKELNDAGHSVLVFSQFSSFFEEIDDLLKEAELKTFKITGKTPVDKRGQIVDDFSESDASVFLLSLQAAGTGLTLTKADYVILYDPWWNPAVENQAIDRTHRIGQDKTVMAYRLIVRDSIEEKVQEIKAEKQALFDEIVNDEEFMAKNMTRDELISLLD